MKHHHVTPRFYEPHHPIYYVHRKRLANPLPDVISVAVLAAIILVAHYIHP